MTLDEFRRLTANSPGILQIVTNGDDRSYWHADAEITTALREGRRQLTEDHGEDTTPEKEYGPREIVIVIS